LSKTWDYIKFAKIELTVLVSVLAFDLITKDIIANTLELDQSVQLIPNFIYFWYTHNKNAAFSFDFGLTEILGQNGVRIFFVVITFVAITLYFIFLYKLRFRRKFLLVMIAFVIAGAFGNLVDRIVFGYVRDFIYIHYFGLDLPLLGTGFAIFNIADTGLVVGIIGVIVYIIFMFNKDNKRLGIKTNRASSKIVTKYRR